MASLTSLGAVRQRVICRVLLYLEFVSRATHDGKEVKHVLRLNPESWALMNQAMVVSMEYLELDSLSAILDSHVADGLSQFVCVGGNDALFKRMA